MRAVILAAGRGGRLRGAAGDRPKCLAGIGSRLLLERQIETLRACGIDHIAVVAGYRAADVRRVCGASVDIVHNARYATTNSLYSLWLARDLIAGLVYAAIFLAFGISQAERRFYLSKATELVGRSVPAPPVSEGA